MDMCQDPPSPALEHESTAQASSSGQFLPPSIHPASLLSGDSYAQYTPIPDSVSSSPSTPCVLGVDEAGRGPVLGPMVYSAFYLPCTAEQPLLASTHHFNDSKQLTTAIRTSLMRKISTEGTDLHTQCGYAVKVMSARDISSDMMRPAQYNLNAQAYDATIEIIKGVIDRGVNITEVYVDTVGRPETYQKRLQHIFPNVKVTVEKKADAKFPCVSAASVVAKVTRDISLEVLWGGVRAGFAAINLQRNGEESENAKPVEEQEVVADWGSGYPSDGRCTAWLKNDMHPLFGWGNECRFSWGTAKDLLESGSKNGPVQVDWPVDDDEEGMRVTQFFAAGGSGGMLATEADQMRNWFGTGVGQEAF